MGFDFGKVFEGAVKLLPVIIQAISTVEKLAGGKKGKDKEDLAVDLVGDLLPLTEAAIGRDLLNDAEVQAAVRELMRAAVATMNVVNAVKAKKLLADPAPVT